MRRNICILTLLCALVSACSGVSITINEPTQPIPTSGVQSPAMPADLPSVRIVNVVDGDTVDVSLNGKSVPVRLIGINTPETVDPRKPVECFGKEASDRAKAILSNQTVYLESDSSQQDRDKYDRLLRYIWFSDGRFFNLDMVAQGYAYEYTYDVPYKYQALFKQAQQQAQSRQLGLWSPQTCSGKP
ncbi:MAG TPA: thermonuclease family protein [Aggregatilineales bacterium]|nr:thermonuclease family protein [Aggregatilineales bacterium]